MLTGWRTLLEAARLGSLSAAAESLGYTQSAVSRQIAVLERAVGVPLLERHARGVVLTAAGEAFGHHARLVVSEADRAVAAARAAEARRPTLTVGATPSTAASVVPAAIRRLRAEDDGFAWSLVPALSVDLEAMVASGALDVAVVTDARSEPLDRTLDVTPLGTDEMVVIAPADRARRSRRRVPLARFAEEVWVEDNEGSAALLRQAAARAGFEPRIELAAADLLGKTAVVAAGEAVALVPGVMTAALRTDVTWSRLVDPPRRGLFAITARNAAADTTLRSRFLEHVASALAATPGHAA